MEKRIPYEKALEILEKIDDSYFSEAVTSDYKLLDEVWQMLDLARSMIYNGLLTCGPEGPEGGLRPGQVVLRNSCGGCMVCDEVEVRIPEAAFEISVGWEDADEIAAALLHGLDAATRKAEREQ